MHTHSFSNPLFARIQKHAIPLVDSLEDVISRAFDHLEASLEKNPLLAKAPKADDGRKIFPASSTPDLTHTTLLTASVDGILLVKGVSWNKLMENTIRAAGKSGCSAEDIMKMMEVPAAVGNSPNYSYTYVSEAGISVQGQNSNRAWKQAVRIAKEVGFEMEASWIWQHKDKAYMPGITGFSRVTKDR